MSVERSILVPVVPSLDTNLHIADWYAANLKRAGDRLVFVSVLVPTLRDLLAPDADSGCVDGLNGGGSEWSIETTVADNEADAERRKRLPVSPIEATMERQLAESVRREERLAKQLKARGCAAFRYIHAFGRSRVETLVRIASEQRASLILATYDALTATDDFELSWALRLLRRARLALIQVPEPAVSC